MAASSKRGMSVAGLSRSSSCSSELKVCRWSMLTSSRCSCMAASVACVFARAGGGGEQPTHQPRTIAQHCRPARQRGKEGRARAASTPCARILRAPLRRACAACIAPIDVRVHVRAGLARIARCATGPPARAHPRPGQSPSAAGHRPTPRSGCRGSARRARGAPGRARTHTGAWCMPADTAAAAARGGAARVGRRGAGSSGESHPCSCGAARGTGRPRPPGTCG